MAKEKKALVTGSAGLVGSEVCFRLHAAGYFAHGIDNNQRAAFFGAAGDTRANRARLERSLGGYVHHDIDMRDRSKIEELVKEIQPDAIVHAAAQPSHDLAARMPFEDFDTNAVGTLNLLEAARRRCPEAPFVFLSTNKVYGDRPNALRLREEERRWEFDDPRYERGIPEDFGIDQTLHSLFGASKAAADLMTQEYGRYFGMPTCCLRGGCLTGPNHRGVELHGFLSYLVRRNLQEREYTVFGYKGKQVRDHLHASDVARFVASFIERPRSGVVYNIGGGKENSCSILEAFALVEGITGKPMRWRYDERHRSGDHVCYYSDLSRIQADYPEWSVAVSLEGIARQIAEAGQRTLEGKRRGACGPEPKAARPRPIGP